ncbi:FAD synthetase [Parasphaerochaeta coccoides]|uniref:FAD synthase n=1 Tax=Parasphaerochaeta coccoides (strain ATCC BAA-1237 / DSM 17374 / SPN1) TaxID=760011 RepID=F4GK53_PARC1|nr:FAD synthetase [Parasphaerochaeta coccoides]AEC01825.1 FAD synthetase [Parasphaerochaeta coccoides DSM 17374]
MRGGDIPGRKEQGMQMHDFMSLVANPILWQVPMVIAIGVFDGIHLGHQLILKECVSLAHEHTADSWQSMVITFNRNPKMTHGSKNNQLPLITARLEHEMFVSFDLDHHVIIDFSDEISKLSGEEFLGLVCGFCSVRAVVVGEDFRCGAPDKSAGPVQLQEYLQRMSPGGQVIVPPFYRTEDGLVASSSRIRALLLDGNIPGIKPLLGRDYSVDLAPYPFTTQAGCLRYRVSSIAQLLPPAGMYETVFRCLDGTARPAHVSIDAEFIDIRLPEQSGEMAHGKATASFMADSLGFVRSFT